MSELPLYKGGKVTSSSLNHFLDRKVSIALKGGYMACFNKEYPAQSASIYTFEKWARHLPNESREVRGSVTPNDARDIWNIINESK